MQVKESPDRRSATLRSGSTAAARAVERPPAPPSVQRLADSLAGGPQRPCRGSESDLRLFAVPDRRRDGLASERSSPAISLEPYEHSASRALDASLIFAGVAFLLILVATRLIVDRARFGRSPR